MEIIDGQSRGWDAKYWWKPEAEEVEEDKNEKSRRIGILSQLLQAAPLKGREKMAIIDGYGVKWVSWLGACRGAAVVPIGALYLGLHLTFVV
jgi:hypothetical protein